MIRVNDRYYPDRSPVTHAEYQLFIDEMRTQGKNRQPDHWDSYEFAPGSARTPVMGIRRSDAEEFCEWLSGRTGETFELPERGDLDRERSKNTAWKDLPFFAKRDRDEIPVLGSSEILNQVSQDVDLTTRERSGGKFARASARLAWFDLFTRARARARVLDRDRDLDRAHARALNLDLSLHLDRAAFALNWLTVVEKRARGEMPPGAGLWLARTTRASVARAAGKA